MNQMTNLISAPRTQMVNVALAALILTTCDFAITNCEAQSSAASAPPTTSRRRAKPGILVAAPMKQGPGIQLDGPVEDAANAISESLTEVDPATAEATTSEDEPGALNLNNIDSDNGDTAEKEADLDADTDTDEEKDQFEDDEDSSDADEEEASQKRRQSFEAKRIDTNTRTLRVNIAETSLESPADQSAQLIDGGNGLVSTVASEKIFAWAAPNIRYQPLYFEDVASERYGQTPCGCEVRQTVLSTAHFFQSAALLPLKMLEQDPQSCDWPLGFCRPGTDTPFTWQKQLR